MATCLVVDDTAVIRSVARACLERLGFEVLEAENGAVALELCEKGLPDMILLDWQMPVMDGGEFLQALRGRPGGERTAVVLCSAEPDAAALAEVAGADAHLVKPFRLQMLVAKLGQVGLLSTQPKTEPIRSRRNGNALPEAAGSVAHDSSLDERVDCPFPE